MSERIEQRALADIQAAASNEAAEQPDPIPDADLENWAFWSRLVPELAKPIAVQKTPAVKISASALEAASRSMEIDGFLQMGPVFTPVEINPIRDAILKLQSVGLAPVYIYVFEHPWFLFQRLQPLISHFLGDQFLLLPNCWAWHIPAIEGASGWPRHRDCDGQTRFESPDGGQTLISLSLWVPLTDAGVENGCMHVLPRSQETSSDEGVALPATAGSVLGWAQDLFHWSGQVQANASGPRISLSLEFQNTAFAPMAQPLLDIATPPPFAERLALVRQQFPKYQHLEDPVGSL